MRVARTMILLGLAAQGCAIQAPKIDVLQARLTSLGVLDQQVQVQLCISNPNRRELAFSRVTADVAIGGERLAAAVNDTPVTLPPLGSVSLPFTVSTPSATSVTSSAASSGTAPCAMTCPASWCCATSPWSAFPTPYPGG